MNNKVVRMTLSLTHNKETQMDNLIILSAYLGIFLSVLCIGGLIQKIADKRDDKLCAKYRK